jgi:hypothetical protein
MRRGVAMIIGLCILATGVWLIAAEHSHTAACNAASGPFSGAAASCQTVGWMYFGGFVVAGIGLMVLLFASLLKRHEPPYRLHHDPVTELSIRMHARDASADANPPRSHQ